jgi:subtilase family serine protease
VPIRHLASRAWRHGGLSVIAAVATLGILPAVAAAPAATARPPEAAASPAAPRPAAAAATRPVPAVIGLVNAQVQLPTPEPTSQCLSTFGINCYSPLQYRQAYNLNRLYADRITGRGRTIVIVDSFGSPTIGHDLHVFDKQFGLRDVSVRIFQTGKIKFDPNDPTMVGWADETTLDVEYAHAIAPDAQIVLVETPVAETEGVTGFPEMMRAEKTLIDRRIGDVISQSFGATENTFPGFSNGDFTSLMHLRYAFTDAVSHGVTVLASSGDAGATDAMADGSTLYTSRVNSWPSSDPLVTSVGGTQLDLDNSGNRLQSDAVWNDGFGAGGGGDSAVFHRPIFQNGVAGVVGAARGTPDISMSAAVNGGCWVYESFAPVGAGWEIFGGTSEATPIFAGIVALADQAAGHRLGDINSALYTLGELNETGRAPFNTGIMDITTGDNSFGGVAGFKAAAGYDMASGWGTVDANAFVRALAHIAG